MSTDTDDEGGGRARFTLNDDTFDEEDIVRGQGQGQFGPVSVSLITANVGSIFEDSANLVPTWHNEVTAHLSRNHAQFVAIHFQEVRASFCFFANFETE